MYGMKILVVDDEKTIRDAFLHAFDEYRVVPASCADEALSILKRPHNIKLIILDHMMPGKTGLDLLKEIKSLQPQCKVVMMTGHSSKENILKALRNKADDFIEKPFDLERMRGTLRRLVEEIVDSEEKAAHKMTKMEQVYCYIRRNFDKPLLLKKVAEEVYLSPKYLSRLFKEKTGMTFNEYKILLRVEAAKQFLQQSSYTISQIALRLGYHNPDSFMRMFKKYTACRPSEFRNNFCKKEENEFVERV